MVAPLCPPRDTSQKEMFQFKELETCSHVGPLFLLRITIAPPLTALPTRSYQGVAECRGVCSFPSRGGGVREVIFFFKSAAQGGSQVPSDP